MISLSVHDGQVGPDVVLDAAALRPVWPGYCADPFVLPVPGGYVMYGTTPCPLPGGRAFQVLHSTDLRAWTDRGGALEPLPGTGAGTEYWAPEVAAHDGAYWMYYSVGTGDSGHHLRVAVSRDPHGPFTDCGVDLSPDLPFAIDPSPFRDPAGEWWLYFATDDLSGPRPGTVLAVAPLHGMTRLAGPARIVLRADADWQRFARNRRMYGGRYDWHTLEGPHVVARSGGFWMFYSGGNWQTPGYGVGLAHAGAPEGPWTPVGTGARVLSAARTGLAGPGHNSVFTDQDGAPWTAFHAWDTPATARSPHLARLVLPAEPAR